MTADAYLESLLGRITAPTGALGPGNAVRNGLLPVVQQWAGSCLSDFTLSGSYAKGTAVLGDTDVDLFISLKSDTTGTLAEIYQSLATKMGQAGCAVRRQNVSIGINYGQYKVDLVPGRRQGVLTSDHSLYVSRLKTWRQTNIATHINTVGNSGRTREIRVLKRWRDVHKLDFLSFALELTVLRALLGRSTRGALSLNVWTALEWLRDNASSCALTDPANTNNNLMDELAIGEKLAIVNQAKTSLSKKTWNEIVW